MRMRKVSSGPLLSILYILIYPLILLAESDGPKWAMQTDLGLRCLHMQGHVYKRRDPCDVICNV